MRRMRLIATMVLSSAAAWAVACGSSVGGDAQNDRSSGGGRSITTDEGGSIAETPVYRNPDGSPNTEIRCGSSVCDSTVQDCCVGSDDTMAHQATFTCTPKGTCGTSNAFFMSCSSTANCPVGEICCGTWMTDAPVVQVDCRASCTGPSDLQFCATDNECAPGQTCTQASFDSCSGDAGTPLFTVQ